jgi:glutathionyl-hydroquinone reductase
MGLLVDGKWVDQNIDRKNSGGRYVRATTGYRNWITADGSAGPSGTGGFKAEAGRYLLYVALACPWAHRTLILRQLKGLEEMIPISVVHTFMGDKGWTFADGPGVIPDPIGNAEYLHQVYTRADPEYSGRVSVPVLWDQEGNTIVSNESSEIIRMLNSAFDGVGATPGDYSPDALLDDIDAINEPIYANVNNGVYRAGFATSQDAYNEAVRGLFATLDDLDARLAKQRYLVGDTFTEADIRLFTTLYRFDPVYVGHFKCNIRRIFDYPNLWNYLLDIYQIPGIAGTCDLEHCRQHYYTSHETVNPTQIVPAGPDIDFDAPHDRAAKFG